MSWTTATDELRRLLSDGPTDKLRYRKRLFGKVDGSNTQFKTLEARRITNFSTAVAPLGVYVDGTSVGVTTDFTESGDLVLALAPSDGSVVEGSYYVQWYNDNELTDFLLHSAQWLGFSLADQILDGLRPSALNYAAGEAYQKLAMKWTERLSETFLLDDQPDADRMKAADIWLRLAATYKKDATKYRDDFYERQGQQLQPNFGVVRGRAGSITPKR